MFDHKPFLKTLTHRPGVYRMIGDKEQVLYVGKAKDLKNRVTTYFQRSNNLRIQTMVNQIVSIEVAVTHTEAEALLLENNLIKALDPKYNILLRDSKSYPYIFVSADKFPRLVYHRGARSAKGRYFGPYPSAGAVRETMQLMQKLFPVRQCDNSSFNNRSRPCLQYQIKRCDAPCVGYISAEDYQRDVDDVLLFLQGKTNNIIDSLISRMKISAEQLEYEQAARNRDQIDAIRKVQERQYVSGERGDLDIVACALGEGQAAVQVFYIRSGRNLGNKVLFPRIGRDTSSEAVISALIARNYLGKNVPAELLVSHMPEDREVLETALSAQANRKVVIRNRVRSNRAEWLKMAEDNARISLKSRLASGAGMRKRLNDLRDALELEDIPSRMECFDISHTSGQQTVASCVVFNQEGPLKSDYRRFNIRDITPGDDYAAMRQALHRRYTHLKAGEAPLPDILFIDGGKGQLSVANDILEELAVTGVLLVGVAKGADRKPGLEQLILLHRAQPLILPDHAQALHLIQQIRDEAHRFAITGHRQRRAKAKRRSVLEDIPGIGNKRRQQLLTQLGGLQGVARAGIKDLAVVPGISAHLAKKIYEVFHGEE